MVVVGVTVEDQLDVLGLEAERSNARVNQRDRLRQGSVDQDQPRVRGDEDGGHTGNADVVGIAEHLERRARLVPLGTAVALDRRIRLEVLRRHLAGESHGRAQKKGGGA